MPLTTRRFLSRQLSAALREAGEDIAEAQRIEALRRIFLGDVSQQVESALGEIRNLRLEGPALRTRLEALRERYRLSSPTMWTGPQPGTSSRPHRVLRRPGVSQSRVRVGGDARRRR